MRSVAKQADENDDLEPQEIPLDYVPLMHSLAGDTHAINEAHGIARVELLNLLANDETVQSRFAQWSQMSRHGHRTAQIGASLDEIAHLMGYPDRFALWAEDAQERLEADTLTVEIEDELDPTEIERLQKLPETVSAAIEDMCSSLIEDGELHSAMKDSMRLVREEWKLPWPWLAAELFQMWLYGTTYGALGESFTISHWYEPRQPSDASMPAFSFHFETQDGESIAEAFARLHECLIDSAIPAFSNALKEGKQETPTLPPGRRSNSATIRQYVEWLYRSHIHGESIRSIAEGDDGRSHVRYGIGQAEKWLGAVTYSAWKDPWEN